MTTKDLSNRVARERAAHARQHGQVESAVRAKDSRADQQNDADTTSTLTVILISATPGSDLSIELQSGCNRLGRQRENNQIVLVSPQISREHAEIIVGIDQLTVRDLGSGNGTFVNGHRVSETDLHDGDLVAFSDKFTFRVSVQSAQSRVAQPKNSAAPANDSGHIKAKSIPLPVVPPLEPAGPAAPPLDINTATTEPRSSRHEDARSTLIHWQGGNQRVATLERDKQRLIALNEASVSCMSANTFEELDSILLDALERTVPFERGFLTYKLPSDEWKLVISPKGDRWDGRIVRKILQTALKAQAPFVVLDSRNDSLLGSPPNDGVDQRLLVPLRTHDRVIGAVFLIATDQSFDGEIVQFLSMFAQIAALGIANCE